MREASRGAQLVEAGPIRDGAGKGVIDEDLAHAAAAQLDAGGEDVVLGFDGLLFFLSAPADAFVEVDGGLAGLRDERYSRARPAGQGRRSAVRSMMRVHAKPLLSCVTPAGVRASRRLLC
jgi:hypothetical protein